MEISYSTIKINKHWHAVVVLGTEHFVDVTKSWPTEDDAAQTAKLMSERLACSLKTQLLANRFFKAQTKEQ